MHCTSLWIKSSAKCINGNKQSHIYIFAYSLILYYKERKGEKEIHILLGAFCLWMVLWLWFSLFGGRGFFVFSLRQSACPVIFLFRKAVCSQCLPEAGSISTLSSWGCISALLPKARQVSITQDGCRVSETAFTLSKSHYLFTAVANSICHNFFNNCNW